MASEAILSALTDVIIDKLVSSVIPQIGIAFGTVEMLEKLKRIMETLQSVIVEAEERQIKDTSIRRWLSALKNEVYEAGDLLEEFDFEAQRKIAEDLLEKFGLKVQTMTEEGFFEDLYGKVISYCSSSNPIITGLSLCWRLSHIVEKIDALAEEMNKFNFQPKKEPQRSYVRYQTHPYNDSEEVLGREKEKKQIVRFLINQEASQGIAVLPIVAIGGMGKTALSKLVYRDERVKGHFKLHMWVCVSDNFILNELIQQMIMSATKKPCSLENPELLQHKIRNLISKKKYLIVLDDVWIDKPAQWKELKTLLECGGEGSAVVVTTRSLKAAEIMATNVNNILHLKKLPEENSWELFKSWAFPAEQEVPADLIRIGKKIVSRCGGHPLALRTLGSLMRFKKKNNEWVDVLESEIWRIKDAQDEILTVLRLSYSCLPPHLKQCFTFCALYPKDFAMEKETLIQLWMANGYIPVNERTDLEAGGEEIFNELIWRSLLEIAEDVDGELDCEFEGYTIKCKMHDLMHDFAQSIMGDGCLNMQNFEKWEDIPTTLRHLRLPSFQKFLQPHIHIPATVRTLLNLRDELCSFEMHGTSLRALALTSINFPKQINIKSQLRHLRLLDLSLENAKELPKDICSLYNLQTLKLSDCYGLERLPDELTVLENLRHLYICSCFSLVYMPKKMGRMKQLRTLTMYVVSDDAERGIEQLKDLKIGGRLELRGIEKVTNAMNAKDANLLSKENLQYLSLNWGEAGSLEVFEALKPHSDIRTLVVVDYAGQQFPVWMNESMQLRNLVKICLLTCQNCEELPPFWQLQFLKCLELESMDEVRHIISKSICCNAELPITFFPSLQKLDMSNMKNLEDWFEAEGSNEQSLHDQKLLPCLSKLCIKNCVKLKGIPALPSLQHLTLISSDSDSTEPTLNTANVSCVSPLERDAFRKFEFLKHLEIFGNKRMRPLLEKGEEIRSLCSTLQYLKIEDCDWMFSSPIGLWENLDSLQSLRIKHCNTLYSLPEEFQSFCSLKTMTLESCPNLSILFSSTSYVQGPRQSQLKELGIKDCNNLKSLQGLNSFTKLQHLSITDCAALETLPDGIEDFTQLRDFEILRCNRLKWFPEEMQRRLSSLNNLLISGPHVMMRSFQFDGDSRHHILRNPRHAVVFHKSESGAN